MRIKRSIAVNLLGFFIPIVTTLLSIPIFLHELGTSAYGIIILASSVAGAISSIDLGASFATVRFVSSDIHKKSYIDAVSVIKVSLTFYALLGLVVSFGVFVFSNSILGWFDINESMKSEALSVFRIVAVQTSITLVFGCISGIFKAIDNFDIAVALNGASNILMNLGAAGLLYLHYIDLVGMAYFQLAVAAALTTLAYCLMRIKLAQIGCHFKSGTFNRATIRRIFSFGAVMTLHTIVGALFSNGIRILIGKLSGVESITIYHIAFAAFSKIQGFVNAIMEVAYPQASRLDANRIWNFFRKAQKFNISITLSLIVLAWVAAPIFFHLWVGKEVASKVSELTPWLLAAYMFISISALPYHVLNGIGKPIISVVYSIGNATVFLISLLIIMKLGSDFKSVAIAYAISNCLSGLVFQAYVPRILKEYSQ